MAAHTDKRGARSGLTACAASLASVLGHPGVAAACAVCGSSQSKENQVAYLVTTGFMTFLPLGLVGLVVLWIWRRAKQLEAESQALSGTSAPSLEAVSSEE